MADISLLSGPLLSDGSYPELTRRLRLGIVGGGRIARVHRWASALSERWNVVASFAKEYQTPGMTAVDLARLGIRTGENERLYQDFAEMAESEANRPDGIDAVAICLPNHLHFEAASWFLGKRIAVLCEKPLVTDPADGEALEKAARENNCIGATSYPYAAYPMIRQARHLVKSGLIGEVTQLFVEFTQDFLVTPSSGSGAEWRLDPALAGMAGSTADIGTHALQLLEYASGLEVRSLCANLSSCGASKALDDTFHILLRCERGVPGVMMGTQVGTGMTTGPQFRIHGEKGTLSWSNGSPQDLVVHMVDGPTQIYSRGMGRGIALQAERFSRRGRGNSEGWVEAFSNLYLEFALAVAARRDNAAVPPGMLSIPDFAVGLRGVRFVEAALKSAGSDGSWVDI